MKSSPSFSIIGGGIGGLTTAIALQQKGFQATVYEHAPLVKPLGAGLSLSANAVKALDAINLSDDVLRAGKVLKKMIIKDQHGAILSETDAEALNAKLGIINNFTIHRADLHQVLINHLQKGSLITGKGCTGFEQRKDGVTLTFQDGTTAHSDYVIACDGIHSVFRKKLVPGSTPRYAGYTCWRAVIDYPGASFNFDEASETWGPQGRFGIVPLSHDRVYWFACVNARQQDVRMKSFTPDDLQSWFGSFHPPVGELLKRTRRDQLIWSDIIDLEPIKKFAFGNIVLTGDAAHATTPNMGQGACMAIEDAVILSNCIDQYISAEEAFVQFERKRIQRTTRIVKDSWSIGKIAQLENPLLVKLRNTAIKLTPQRVTEKQMRFLYEISF